jgi:hypothetical protein
METPHRYLIDVKIEYLEKLLEENKVTKSQNYQKLEDAPWWKFRTRSMLRDVITLNSGVNNGLTIAINVLKDKSITNSHGEGSTFSRRASQHSKGNR